MALWSLACKVEDIRFKLMEKGLGLWVGVRRSSESVISVERASPRVFTSCKKVVVSQ